jgi:hypothetical protein
MPPVFVATFSWTRPVRDRRMRRHGTQEVATGAGAREAAAHPLERGGAAAGGWSRQSRRASEHFGMGTHGIASAGRSDLGSIASQRRINARQDARMVPIARSPPILPRVSKKLVVTKGQVR